MLMEKIDRRRHYILVVDTETANTLQQGNKLDMSSVLPYDIGWAVIDTHGTFYEKRSYVNRDIFVFERKLMRSAYYAEKIPKYIAEIRSGQRIMASTYEIRQAMLSDIEAYGIKEVAAHNARFDYTALGNIQKWTTKSKYRYFLPFGIEWWDTMKMVRSVICKMPTYRKFCEENGYLTPTGQLRVTAEILWRFISKDNEFEEAHTGLEDVEIEAQILAYCYRQHKKMEKRLWRDVKEFSAPTAFQRQLLRSIKDCPVI